MPARPAPGPLFTHISSIRKELVTERVVFSDSKPLCFELFQVPFDWIFRACESVREQTRFASEPEFWEPSEPNPCFCVINHMRLEVISAGASVVLLLNTCPVAEVDIKGAFGLAVFFEMPPMNKAEWDLWELLGASTIHMELLPDSSQLRICHVKQEEGKWNTLRLVRELNLSSGASRMEVTCEHHQLSAEPSLENLMDWIEVRAGRAHPALLQVTGRKRGGHA